MCLFKDGLSLQKTLMWVLQADKPSGTCIIMNYWSRAKTWVFRGKQSWVLWSCFVSHNDFTVMCNKGLFDPVNQSRKSQLERAYKEEWKTNVLWEHLVPPFQQHFKTLLPPTQHVSWLLRVLQSCTATSTLTLPEYLRLWSIIWQSCTSPSFAHTDLYPEVLPNQLAQLAFSTASRAAWVFGTQTVMPGLWNLVSFSCCPSRRSLT